jgi:hypothetical protein
MERFDDGRRGAVSVSGAARKSAWLSIRRRQLDSRTGSPGRIRYLAPSLHPYW